VSYQLTTTPEGLRIATLALPHAESVSIAITVDVGARWEEPGQHGISHLLEHMAFKGTATHSAQAIAEAFDAIGAHFNAYTSHEHTVYHVKLLKEDWPLAVELLSDILQHSLYAEDELEREQHVILQELAMVNDTPDEVVFDLFQQGAFGTEQALGRTIIGSKRTILGQRRQDILDWVEQHYQPRRMVITAAGAVTHEAFVEALTSQLKLPDTTAPTMPLARYTGGKELREDDFEQLHLMLGVEGVVLEDEDFYTMQCLTSLLGGGTSSRLFQEVREKRGLAYSIHAMAASYIDTGVFMVSAATAPEDVETLIPVILQELQQVREGVSADELARAKRQHIASLRLGFENTLGVAEWLGRDLTYFNSFRPIETQTEAYEAVTLEAIQALAKRLFSQPNWTVSALGPGAERAGALVS
tara:strand:+ start:1346 stop:2590 length:1245 start_codon:yes stop_codon:yes gene_type:complete